MARLKIKEEYIGAEIFISPSLTLIFSEHMSDNEYNYGLIHFPQFFESKSSKPKKVKKNDKA